LHLIYRFIFEILIPIVRRKGRAHPITVARIHDNHDIDLLKIVHRPVSRALLDPRARVSEHPQDNILVILLAEGFLAAPFYELLPVVAKAVPARDGLAYPGFLVGQPQSCGFDIGLAGNEVPWVRVSGLIATPAAEAEAHE